MAKRHKEDKTQAKGNEKQKSQRTTYSAEQRGQ
jgi:hypothetical protein